MRTLISLLLLAPALAGCTDALGVGGPCSAEMYEVRLQRGPPDETAGGNQAEIWFYDATGSTPRVSYEFDWSSGSCVVSQRNFLLEPAG